MVLSAFIDLQLPPLGSWLRSAEYDQLSVPEYDRPSVPGTMVNSYGSKLDERLNEIAKATGALYSPVIPFDIDNEGGEGGDKEGRDQWLLRNTLDSIGVHRTGGMCCVTVDHSELEKKVDAYMGSMQKLFPTSVLDEGDRSSKNGLIGDRFMFVYAGVVTLTLLYLGSRVTESTAERCCLVAIDIYTTLPYAGSYT
ncbi:hypothetical protein ARMSODRAFT_1061147 [Armillaria solidipes]|uniref:Uncharacterized protein n=1 Tax=Armillaria solidipes TaxID=1076256 RepID=A0A2H3AVI6_9AGAR|nr:hypothetical protein ARMSODRAFT_1061147 [Armillaria solidipes]